MKRPTYRCEKEKYKELSKKLIDDDLTYQDFADWCVDQYLKGNYNPKGEMIEMLVEKGSLLVDSGWVRENDIEVFEFLKDRLEDFVADEDNTATEKDVKDFEKGDYLVEYFFNDGDVAYIAGRTKQDIANQPNWGEDSWKDIESIEKYYNELKKQ